MVMSEHRAVVDSRGRPMGTVIGAEVAARLHALVDMILEDILGAPVEFAASPTPYVKVSYLEGATWTDLLHVTLDVAFQRVRLQLARSPPVVLDPLGEPRFRLARKVETFIAAAVSRRREIEGESPEYRPRRRKPSERCSRCPGSCYVMERTE